MKIGRLFVNEERVRHPNQIDVLSTDHQFLQSWTTLERQPRVLPELTKVHVKGKVLKRGTKEKEMFITRLKNTLSFSIDIFIIQLGTNSLQQI